MAEGVTVNVKLVSDNMPKLREGMRRIANRELVAGYPALKNKPRDKGEPITNAALAYIHNKGSPARNIPARPFMVEGVELRRARITHYLESAAKAALEGNIAKVDAGFTSAGLQAQAGIREKITKGPFQQLSDKYKIAKAAAGYDPEAPLRRTGQMRRAVDYAVRYRARM